jgi:hypothetical protein
MALSCAGERIDHKRENVCEGEVCRVCTSRRGGLVFEVDLRRS